MDCAAPTETSERALRFLEAEAVRVARRMASLRNERVHRLSGPSAIPPDGRAFRGSPRLPRKAGGAAFSPFYYYPFLFATAFPSLTAESLRTLALANRILLEAILLSDRHIDENRPWTPEGFYLVDGYFHKALEMLIPLFPLEHEFWQRTQGWFLQHGRAVLKEQLRHRYRLCPYTRDEFFEIATGKVALIKTNLLAMGSLSGTWDAVRPLMESQDRFLAGFQCFDDLRDWKEDLRHGNFTFLLTRVLLEGGFQHLVREDNPVPPGEVGQILYYQGFAEEQLRLAEQYFHEALHAVREVHVPRWAKTVRRFLRHCHMMRFDLAEIRRRTTDRTEPKALGARIEEALSFLVRSASSVGGLALTRSAYPYMNPSAPLAPSRFATAYLRLALAPLQGMDSRLPVLLRNASDWLAASQGQPSDPSLPAALEESFLLPSPDRRRLLAFDEALDGTLPLRPHGLFWANVLYTAARANVRLTKLETLARASIHQADYTRWTRSPPSESPGSSSGRGVCHPLLALLLFCHAFGPDLPRKPAHDYLLRRGRTTGTWNNPTETALSLLCLLFTGYRGPELSPAVEKLARTQEPGGSWPPNALYEEEDGFYGSRELTTAWCLLALFLYRLGPPLPAAQRNPRQAPEQGVPDPKIVLHRGLPDRLHGLTHSVLEQLQTVLSPPRPHTLYVGHWPAMPPHFLLNARQGVVVGVNALPHKRTPALSTSRRPLKVETVMATLSAHRCLARGPLKDRLERLFVAGIALCTSKRFWPCQAPWKRLGMRKLDWSWCREHEAFLWEELRRFLVRPSRGNPVFRWLLPDHPASPVRPIPKGAALFLAESLLAGSLDGDDPFLKANDLLAKRLPDILRAFRRKVGLENDENSLV